MKRWIEDIRIKTKDMNREQAAEYVLTYYWYHILLGTIALGLIILFIYHVGWGRNRKPEFACVIVNQEVDFLRDARMAEEFSGFSGIREKKLSIDSDYLISYDEVRLPEANESSYEKFFFNWSSGVIDAMIMPESFYKYCLELGGVFCDLRELFLQEETDRQEKQISQENMESLGDLLYQGAGEEFTAVYIEGTALEKWLETEEEDPLLLVFPLESKHKKNSGLFLEYALNY